MAPAAGLAFGAVSDTHVNVSDPSGQRSLALVYAALARHDPAFVLHCGDITDTGLEEEYDRYAQLIPSGLAGKLRHVPGNHETRWDASAGEAYRRRFARPPYSFDAGGVHFIGLSSALLLQEHGHYRADDLAWLADDLDRAGLQTPSVVFQHHPIGEDFDDVDRQDRLLQVLAGRGVRGIFVGHTHHDLVRYLNGLTVVGLAAVKNGPVCYWARTSAAADGTVLLRVARVDVADDGSEVRRLVAAMPLTGAGPGVVPRPYPIRFAQVRRPNLPPVTARTPEPRWEYQVSGGVQGALTMLGDVVVAASTAGEVVALRLDGARGVRRRWRAQVGPVYRQCAVDGGAFTVFVPSADHRLYALDGHGGRLRWSHDAGAPVLGQPVVTRVAGRELVVFSAGRRLLAVEAATGRLAWAAGALGFSAGRPASDGVRVYHGAGDGYARAFDAATGGVVWSAQLAAGDEHRRLLYGPWNDTIVLAADTVLVSTVSGAWALDGATGEQRWTLAGASMYPPSLVLSVPTKTVLIITERGTLTCADIATGGVVWQAETGVRVLDSGAVAIAGTAWLQSADGQLVGVDLATGQPKARMRFSLAHCFSSPVMTARGTLVTADQDGVIRGFRLTG
jgi:outer membrane protein assembly factor BamB